MTAMRCHPDLVRLAGAVQVHSATCFSINEQQRDLSALPRSEGEALLQTLAGEIYHRLYCRSPVGQPTPTADLAETRAFVSALSQANGGTGTWEPGWSVIGEEADGTVAASRDGVIFWVEPGGLRTTSGAATPGEACLVRIGKEMRQLFPAFYMALGNRHTSDGDPAPLVRLYWHLTAALAVPYMQMVTERLNAAGLPFQTKVVANPRQYLRTDAGVLYLRKADFRQAAEIVRAVYRTLAAELRPAVPLFTKYLAPGFALAEDPGNGMSFGQSRCQVAARGLWEAHAQGCHTPDARLDALVGAFGAAGLDPEHPHLEPGCTEAYDIDLSEDEHAP